MDAYMITRNTHWVWSNVNSNGIKSDALNSKQTFWGFLIWYSIFIQVMLFLYADGGSLSDTIKYHGFLRVTTYYM